MATAPPTAAPPVEIILPSGIRILAGTATDAILMAVALLSATPRC